MEYPSISIVTPTLMRPQEVTDLLENIALQTLMPVEIIIVDGAPDAETGTQVAVLQRKDQYPFRINYVRHKGGTAMQRNKGIELAAGEFVAFIDDDVRLEPDFLANIVRVFLEDESVTVGGVVGYRANRHFALEQSPRWLWYKRLRLLTVFEPGRYDFSCGYPINSNMQPPFSGTRPVDFVTTACAVWRREVFETGLNFDTFFAGYGVLEDAHFSLRASRTWKLLQAGDARCSEMHSSNGRTNSKEIGYKCVVNYYFVFHDIVKPLTFLHKFRFWRFQAFEFIRIAVHAVSHGNWNSVLELRGRTDAAVKILVGLGHIPRDENAIHFRK